MAGRPGGGGRVCPGARDATGAPCLPSLKADLHILKLSCQKPEASGQPAGGAAGAGAGSRSAGSHMSRSLLILGGRWDTAVRGARPGPGHPAPPTPSPVVEALVGLLAGQEDMGGGQDHF